MTAWTVGQQVSLNRNSVVTIDRVTPSGRAYIGERAFNPDGYERGGESKGVWGGSASRIEALTPEMTEIVQLAERWVLVRAQAHDANTKLGRWVLDRCSSFKRGVPKEQTVNDVERVTDAINAVLSQVTP